MDRYATHLAPLVATALAVPGPILELGCGDYSTPVLAEIARFKSVALTVFSSDKAWASKFGALADVRIVDWSNGLLFDGQWGMVLLDNEQKTTDRIRHLPVLRGCCSAIVLHDLENCEAHAHWPEMSSEFVAIKRHTNHRPGTAVLTC